MAISLLIFYTFSAMIFPMTIGFEGVFWHITDIHLNISYDTSQGGQYGDYNSDSAFPLVQSALQEMKTRYPNPDLIIWNGDNSYRKHKNDTRFMQSIKTVSQQMNFYFPNVTILPSIGNHDLSPANNFRTESKWCEKLYELWKAFLRDLTQSETTTFKKGCYYSRSFKSPNGNLTIIVLNAMLWYSQNPLVQYLTDPLDQFTWLRNELDKSRQNRNKVFIVSHVAPGASEYNPYKFRMFHSKFNVEFLNTMKKYSDVIEAGFFGHQHIDAFKIVYDSKGEPAIPLFVSPSVSPLHLRGLGSINPSIRRFVWNKTNSQSLYYQYHTRIPKTPFGTPTVSLNWSLEYVSHSILPGLSAKHLNNLSLDFAVENSTYFDLFFQYHLSGRIHDTEYCLVNSSCRCYIVCGLRNIDYGELDSCLIKCPKPFLTDWMIVAIVITSIVVGVICTFVIIIIFKNHKRRGASMTYQFRVEKL